MRNDKDYKSLVQKSGLQIPTNDGVGPDLQSGPNVFQICNLVKV
jgi:hypothetical protein